MFHSVYCVLVTPRNNLGYCPSFLAIMCQYFLCAVRYRTAENFVTAVRYRTAENLFSAVFCGVFKSYKNTIFWPQQPRTSACIAPVLGGSWSRLGEKCSICRFYNFSILQSTITAFFSYCGALRCFKSFWFYFLCGAVPHRRESVCAVRCFERFLKNPFVRCGVFTEKKFPVRCGTAHNCRVRYRRHVYNHSHD